MPLALASVPVVAAAFPMSDPVFDQDGNLVTPQQAVQALCPEIIHTGSGFASDLFRLQFRVSQIQIEVTPPPAL